MASRRQIRTESNPRRSLTGAQGGKKTISMNPRGCLQWLQDTLRRAKDDSLMVSSNRWWPEDVKHEAKGHHEGPRKGSRGLRRAQDGSSMTPRRPQSPKVALNDQIPL